MVITVQSSRGGDRRAHWARHLGNGHYRPRLSRWCPRSPFGSPISVMVITVHGFAVVLPELSAPMGAAGRAPIRYWSLPSTPTRWEHAGATPILHLGNGHYRPKLPRWRPERSASTWAAASARLGNGHYRRGALVRANGGRASRSPHPAAWLCLPGNVSLPPGISADLIWGGRRSASRATWRVY